MTDAVIVAAARRVRARPPQQSAPTFRDTFSEKNAATENTRQAISAGGAEADAKVTFGRFLRALRANSNGVLFTICMDMESAFENGVFVLYTTKETLLNTLKRETNYPVVQGALEKIGITHFDIRLKGKEKDEANRAIDEIRERFSDVQIEVKP